MSQKQDIQAFSNENMQDTRVGCHGEPLKKVSKPNMHNPGVRGRRKQNWEKNQIEKSFKLLLRNYFSLYDSC